MFLQGKERKRRLNREINERETTVVGDGLLDNSVDFLHIIEVVNPAGLTLQVIEERSKSQESLSAAVRRIEAMILTRAVDR